MTLLEHLKAITENFDLYQMAETSPEPLKATLFVKLKNSIESANSYVADKKIGTKKTEKSETTPAGVQS